ncbi:hypothetical protein D3C75_1282540 [compost metagenome]
MSEGPADRAGWQDAANSKQEIALPFSGCKEGLCYILWELLHLNSVIQKLEGGKWEKFTYFLR